MKNENDSSMYKKEGDKREEETVYERSCDQWSARITLTVENGGTYDLYYELLKTERFSEDHLIKDNNGAAEMSCYSVMIFEYVGGVCEDSSFAFDITDEKEKALEIFGMLVDETVTPCTLMNVLEDIL